MPDAPVDAQWPKILSLSVHEFRTPLTVAAGYVRMLLKERAGPLSDQQRRLLEEAEKSCARLSALVNELSELSNLEARTAPFNRQRTELNPLLRSAVEQLPPLPERKVDVELRLIDAPSPIDADPVRLTGAITSVIAALRRELVAADPLIVRTRATTHAGGDAHEVTMGDPETLAALDDESPEARQIFDEWRGGVGLSLAIARRVFNAHGGAIWAAPARRKTGARIVLPSA
jgi:signal transduction histidine kinase